MVYINKDWSVITSEMALIINDPWKIVKELYSDLRNLSVSSNLYYARKSLKEQVRRYSDATLQEIAKALLAETDANVEGASVLFGIIASVRVQREQTTAIVPCCPASTNKKLQFENFVYANYRPFLRYPGHSHHEAEARAQKWLQLFSGDLTSLNVDVDGKWVEYGDHVTRMQAIAGQRKERKHVFSLPDLGRAENFRRLRIPELSIQDPTLLERTLAQISEEDKAIICQNLYGFDYTNLENKTCGHCAVILPDGLKLQSELQGECGFNTNEDDSWQIDVSVLHMPIKLSQAMVDQFNAEGRRLPDGAEFRADEVYIPERLAKGADFVSLVKQTLVTEYQLNPERLRNNFLLVTLRVGDLTQSQSLGNTGWHVDGHQGAERLQMDGSKVPIDRVYCMSNTLPTQITDLRLDLGPVRSKARSKLMTLDQFNLQDIIQKTVEKAEKAVQEQGRTIITTAGENRLFYANPYIIHQSPVNPTKQPVRRSFIRLLYTVDERDRIGDTVSPITGPCYPFKIKTIMDILQLPADVDVCYQPGVTTYPTATS